jgi:uncharacterized protein (UPF0332 family)
MTERLDRVIELYERKGTIEKIEGAGVESARACLARAKERLAAAEHLLEGDHWDPAYTTAYDAYRSAADAIVLLHGYRTAARPGAHEATHAFAAAALDASPFAEPTASTFRQGRNASEYFDPERPIDKTKDDAQWAVDQARSACAAVESAL